MVNVYATLWFCTPSLQHGLFMKIACMNWKLFHLPSVCTVCLASRGLTPKAPAYWVVCASCAVCKVQGFVFEYISHVPATCVSRRWSVLLTLSSTMLLSLRHPVSLKEVLSFEFCPILLLFSCRHLTFSVYNRARHIFHFILVKGNFATQRYFCFLSFTWPVLSLPSAERGPVSDHISPLTGHHNSSQQHLHPDNSISL